MDEDVHEGGAGTPGLLPGTAPHSHQQPNGSDYENLKMPWESPPPPLSPTLNLTPPSEAALQEARFMQSVKGMLGEILSPLTHQLGGVQARLGEMSTEMTSLNCQILDSTRRLENLEARLQDEEEEEEVDPAL